MDRIIYRKTLDVHKNGTQFTLQGFQSGDNLARRLEIGFSASGDTYDLPNEGIEAMMYVTTPSATQPSIEACTINGNTVVYDLSKISEAGTTAMQLKLIQHSINGAKQVIASPKFEIEVQESNVGDEEAETRPEFSALEDATAKALGAFKKRLVKVEVADDLIFRAYFADGETYESDSLVYAFGKSWINPRGEYESGKEYNLLDLVIYDNTAWLAVANTTDVPSNDSEDWENIFALNTAIESAYADISINAIAEMLKEDLDIISKAQESSDLNGEYAAPTFVSWNKDTLNTPYTNGLTENSSGFALVHNYEDLAEGERRQTVVAWTTGGSECFVKYTKGDNVTGYASVITSAGGKMDGKLKITDEGAIFADENGTYIESGNDAVNNRVYVGNPDVVGDLGNALIYKHTDNGASEEYRIFGEHNPYLLDELGYGKIVKKTYTGDGAITRTIDFGEYTPFIVFVASVDKTNFGTGDYHRLNPFLRGTNKVTYEYEIENSQANFPITVVSYLNLTWNGNAVTWAGSNEPQNMLNDEGKEYVCIAICGKEIT